ncbi:MAG: periplasmic component of the Tol biopolymer transport system like protein, partial [Candidatus Aminicenantes bacterium]|nr:periplasmic component of the Tol biopolymer transport system like protein [Candidatus Aminicenantes bacterium]
MNKKSKIAGLLVIVALLAAVPSFAAAEKPLLAQHPSLSRTQIVFAYAGDLWLTGRDGGPAARLTTGVGIESDPAFSPDGSLVAFSGQYDGNTDVYVVAAAGGVPRRLTHHPQPDAVVGWTPDGKRVLFSSARTNANGIPMLFTVDIDGGMPEALPLPTGVSGTYSADGSRLAYVPTQLWQAAWKRYQGGQTTPIWIVSLSDLAVEKIPRENSNDSNPMWIGDRIYFLSDRNGAISLFVYDLATKKVAEALPNDGLDFKSASAGPGGIVIEQFGALHLFDPAKGTARRISVSLEGDLAEVRPHYAKVGSRIASASISPNGARAVFEARGEILTVPAEKGDIRNLTRTTGVMERDPSWSPDGKSIAYFSDESGEYALHIRDQAGQEPVKKIALGEPPSFFYWPVWSPDGKKIAYHDKRLTVWYVDIAKGVPVKVDSTYYYNPTLTYDIGWSPDSRWLTYGKQVPSHMGVICVYSLETGQVSQVTDGLSDAKYPAFDRSGKYLFFTASTDVGLTPGWLNMSSVERPVTRSVYVAVLRKDLPSPLAPESDEEKPKEEDKKAYTPKADAKKGTGTAKDKGTGKDGETPKEPEKVAIELDGIGQRILALPVPAKNYFGLAAAKEGIVFLLEAPKVFTAMLGRSDANILHKFDLSTRKTEKFLDGVSNFFLSATGEKILISQGPQWTIAATAGPVEAGKGVLNTGEMEVRVEPLVEWKQMYREVWRLERDFFYDAGAHGLDLKAAEKKYAPYLEGVASRQDLNYLYEEMLGELTCGHVF